MVTRQRFEQSLESLREDVLRMGSMVQDELTMALEALETTDTALADRVFTTDTAVNAERFAIEDKCIWLIASQQPAARDLRAIIAVMNMIVDLERMGDQAKGIAKVIPHIVQYPKAPKPTELEEMGRLVGDMLRQSMTAYANSDINLARSVAEQDDEVDALYAIVFAQILGHMAKTKKPHKVEATYEVLRVARELERFGDLATNVAERVIFMVTGELLEINQDSAAG